MADDNCLPGKDWGFWRLAEQKESREARVDAGSGFDEQPWHSELSRLWEVGDNLAPDIVVGRVCVYTVLALLVNVP